jgi:phospholipid/cholesterol/gamma-HCH transport system ATP-binding protein
MSVPLLSCKDLEYWENGSRLFHNVSFRLDQGQRGVLLAEPHRCATVLLKICGTLISPANGEVRWFGQSSTEMNKDELYQVRRRIGLIHRESSLISNMTILDNITIGIQYHENIVNVRAHERVSELLKQFDLYNERFLRPAQLTFEKRRLAVYARELAKKPELFLLEHPSLDLGERFHSLLTELLRVCCRDDGCAFLVASLKPETAQRWGDWVLILEDGRCKYLEAAEFDPALYKESARRSAADFSRDRRWE